MTTRCFGHLVVGEGLGAGADAVAVDLDAGQRGGLAAGGDDDVLGGDLDGAVFGFDDRAAGADEAGRAEVARDLVLLEEAVDAAGERIDDFVLAGEHRGEVEADVAGVDAVLGERVLGFGVALARFEQGLAGDAADAEAGAAEAVFFFDAGDVLAELRGADRGDVSAGSAADDEDVVLGHAATEGLAANGCEWTRIQKGDKEEMRG